jgi:hypothetical protein
LARSTAFGAAAQVQRAAPSSLAAPVVAFNNPTALPDPTGLSATLSTLANGNLFRDTSGADTTAALALAALSGAGTGATAAGDQGRAYAALATQKEIEMAKLAAGLANGGLGGGGPRNVTEQGAKINEGRSLDQRATEADPETADTATEHEACAAEGETSKAVDILGQIAARPGPASGSDTTPPSGDPKKPPAESPTTSGGPATPPTPKPKQPPAPRKRP